jgi:hypothetical protein
MFLGTPFSKEGKWTSLWFIYSQESDSFAKHLNFELFLANSKILEPS